MIILTDDKPFKDLLPTNVKTTQGTNSWLRNVGALSKEVCE